MSKKDKITGEYIPGVIYVLETTDNIFYVGESYNPKIRKSQHRKASAKLEERLVYDYTSRLDKENISWDLRIVKNYGVEGPKDLEYEYILELLDSGVTLTNMKRGNRERIEKYKKEMSTAGFTSFKKYDEFKKQKTIDDRIALAAKRQQEMLDEQTARLKHLTWKTEQDYYKKQSQIESAKRKLEKIKKKKELNDLRGYKQSSNKAAQALFDKGHYTAAFNQLGGSYIKFQEEFNISYLECLGNY